MTVQEGSNHRIARQVVVITERKGYGREWEWYSVNAALEITGLWKIREYVRRRKEKFQSMQQGDQYTNFIQAQSGWRVPVGS